jgi:predicted dehydrogenase
MGQRHARVFAGLPDRFELVGAYDVRADVRQAPHVSRLHGEAEAIAAAEVVVVATPIAAHQATVARALRAGRHVLVEKPLCATAAEAQALVAAASGGPARLFVGHSERFNPVVRALARLLRGDRVLAIDFRRVGPSRPSGCSALVNLGVHDFDLAMYLAGGKPTVRCALGEHDFAHVLFDAGCGAVGHLYVDAVAPAKERAIVVTTPRWTYQGDLLTPRLVRTPRARRGRPAAPCTDVPLPLEEPLLAQARALADALDRGSPREIATGADGALSVELAENAAAQCAAAEKLSVSARP